MRGEGRKFSRIPSECSVLVRFTDATEPQRFSTTHVVGLGGCSFMNPGDIPLKTRLRLDIAVGDSVVECDAQVVNSTKGVGPLYEIGVEFLQLTPSDRALLATVFLKHEGEG